MVPFRVIHNESKHVKIALNYQPGEGGGSYLMANDEMMDNDGEISIIPSHEMTQYRFLEFMDDAAGDL